MNRKNSKLMAGLLTTALLIGNTMPAFAADISVTGDTATGSTPTEFSVDEEALGGGLVVTIPASLDLTADVDSGDYVANDVVSAYGNIDACKAVTVSTGEEITYTNSSDASITVDGAVTFGTDGSELWTAQQTKDSITNLDSRTIGVTVEKEDVEYIGTYESTVYFDISLDYIVSPASWFSWQVGDTSVAIDGISRQATSMDIIVPSTYQGLPVVSANFGGSRVTSVVLPDSITTIDDYAFSDCQYLASVTMSNNVTEIGEGAFMFTEDTTALASITLPNSLTSLGKWAFYGCSALTSVTYNDVEYTSVSALETALTTAGVTLGDSVFEGTGLTD